MVYIMAGVQLVCPMCNPISGLRMPPTVVSETCHPSKHDISWWLQYAVCMACGF